MYVNWEIKCLSRLEPGVPIHLHCPDPPRLTVAHWPRQNIVIFFLWCKLNAIQLGQPDPDLQFVHLSTVTQLHFNLNTTWRTKRNQALNLHYVYFYKHHLFWRCVYFRETYRDEQITRNIKKSTILFQRNKFVRTKMRLKEGTKIGSLREIWLQVACGRLFAGVLPIVFICRFFAYFRLFAYGV